MKTYLLKPMVVVCLCLLTASFTFAADNYKMVKVKAPFSMQPIKVFIYPDKDFLITDYGAKNGGEVNNTKAIAAAISVVGRIGGDADTATHIVCYFQFAFPKTVIDRFLMERQYAHSNTSDLEMSFGNKFFF